ncbi:DUF7019 family protein [Micromonospora sp. NPDC005806]|uniref:DUF7019 family protein n=1 Tax=Micromonospora sp. NPDC005806 TaxID=3364234 RepID=UPI0036C8556F
MSFRYYLYISDSKVDMLLQQIDPALTRRRNTEIKVDLKIFGASRGAELPGADRVARLERVVRCLQDHGDLGSVDEPGQFFWGLLPLRWGPVKGDLALIYFGGCSERTWVGLGGSRAHVVGAVPGTESGPALTGSHMPSMLAGLAGPRGIRTLLDDADPGYEQAEVAALSTVRQATARLRGPAQNLEFVAKRLLYGPSPDPEQDPHPNMSVLLGSPLYVALAD